MYSPTTSRTLSMNWGSGGQLEGVDQVRLEPKYPPDPGDGRLRHAEVVDQAASRAVGGIRGRGIQGRDQHLFDLLVGDPPGRDASARPSSRRARNRERRLVTVGREMPGRLTTSALLAPSAQASTLRQRNATAWLDVARLAQRSSVVHSASVSANSGSLGPRRRGGLSVAVSTRGPIKPAANQDSGH
jgi:hypothetical protein